MPSGRRGRAIVVEGYMDVIQLAQAGFGESVAALGTAITGAHVSALLRITDHVSSPSTAMPPVARRRAARSKRRCRSSRDTKRASFMLLPEGEDPGQPDQGARRSRASRPSSSTRCRCRSSSCARSRAEVRSAPPEDRAALVAAAKPLLLSMAPGAMRAQLLRELAEAARLPADEVASMFGLQTGA